MKMEQKFYILWGW